MRLSFVRDPCAKHWEFWVMSGHERYDQMRFLLELLKRMLVLIMLEGAAGLIDCSPAKRLTEKFISPQFEIAQIPLKIRNPA